MQPRFFADGAELRAWLERHHEDTAELLVGLHKKRSGRPSIRAFDARADGRSAIYAYEQRQGATLQPDQARRFRANRRAWEFLNAQPPSYRRTATWWVVSAKRNETRARRLDTLIRDSAEGRRIRPLQRRATS